MAITFVTSGTMVVDDDNTVGDRTIAIPAHNAGDLLVVVMNCSNGTPNLDPAEIGTDVTDWTRLTPGTWSSATAGSTNVYYRIDTDNDITTEDFGVSGDTGSVINVFIYRGVDTTTPQDAAPTYLNNQGAGTSITAPTITTATDNAFVLVLPNRDGAFETMTQPSGYDVRSNEGSSLPGDGIGLYLSDLVNPTFGLEAPGSISWSTSQENNCMTWAIREIQGFEVIGDVRDLNMSTVGTVRCILLKHDGAAIGSRIYTVIDHVNANGSGLYTFTDLTDNDPRYSVMAYKVDTPDVRGVTDDDIVPVPL